MQQLRFPIAFFFSKKHCLRFSDKYSEYWDLQRLPKFSNKGIKCKMTKLYFDRFGVITEGLEEYLVSCPPPPPPRVNSCLRVHDTSCAPAASASRRPVASEDRLFLSRGSCCSVRVRERISSPPRHSLSTARGQHETATRRTWLREEVQERGPLAEDNGVIDRREAPAHIAVSSDFRVGLHRDG